MKNKFAVAVAAVVFYGAVSPAWAISITSPAGMGEAPRVDAAPRAVSLALPGADAAIPSAVLAPAASLAEMPASALQAPVETMAAAQAADAAQAAGAAADGGTLLVTQGPAIAAHVPAAGAPHLSGASVRQALAAAADGSSMDGSANAGGAAAPEFLPEFVAAAENAIASADLKTAEQPDSSTWPKSVQQAYSRAQVASNEDTTFSIWRIPVVYFQESGNVYTHVFVMADDFDLKAQAFDQSGAPFAQGKWVISEVPGNESSRIVFAQPGAAPAKAAVKTGGKRLNLVGSLAPAAAAPAAPATVRSPMATLTSKTTLNASDFKGKPLFEMLTAPNGLKAALDAAETAEFAVADWDTVQAKITAFDPTDPKKIDSLFKSPDGFKALVDALAGKSATPKTMAGMIASELSNQGSLSDSKKAGLAGAIISPLLSLASGSGVEFKIDENNTTFHFGYKSGADMANDPKSGRSFSLTAGRTTLDPSDNYFLKEMGDYFASENPQKFFEAILPALTQSDFSGWKSLSPKGQTLASDFIAIYLAEADRNAMTKFTTHPWQKDLAAVAFLSAYAVKAGKVWKNGKLADGQPSDWFGIGRAGSGIGESRMPRKQFTKEITSAERALHSDVVSAVEKLIGNSEDVIQGFTDYINDPSKQAEVKANADALNMAMAAFLSQIHIDADAITQALSAPVARDSVPASGAMNLVARPAAPKSAAAPDPTLVRAAVSYQKNDELESDTETTGPTAAYQADGNALMGQAHADFTAWSGTPGGQATDVWKVHLRDAQKTLAYYMFQTIPGVGVNFAFYTLEGNMLTSGSAPEGGTSRFGQYLDVSAAPLFAQPSPSDPKGDAATLNATQVAALAAAIQKGVSNDSGWNEFNLSYAARADAGILKGDALTLFNQWAGNSVSQLPPPPFKGEPTDANKPRVYRTTLHMGGVATPMIYVIQSKVTGGVTADWVNFAFFTPAGQLLVNGSYNRGLKWGQLVDPSAGTPKPQ